MFHVLVLLGTSSTRSQICYAAISDTCGLGVLVSTIPGFPPMHRQGARLPLQNDSEQVLLYNVLTIFTTYFWYGLFSKTGFLKQPIASPAQGCSAVFVPRPLPQGPRRPGCLPIRLFMLIQLLLSAPYLNSPSVFGCEIK